jgi:hypothetical protein
LPSLRRTLFAALVAAVVGMGWSAVFWNLVPAAQWVVEPLPNAAELVPILKEKIGEGGVFMYPFLFETADDADVEVLERYADERKSGPLIHLVYQDEGLDLTSPMLPLATFLHTLAAAAFVALVLRLLAPVVRGFAGRLGIALAFGVFAALYSDLGAAIWWNQPWSIHVLKGACEVLSWVFMGAVLAGFLASPEPSPIEDPSRRRPPE